MLDFERYFLNNRQIILENINYETITKKTDTSSFKLNCKDTVLAQVLSNGIKINFNRALNFEPEAIYSLSVTFSIMLYYNPTTKDEIEWSKIDVAGEFKKSCPRLMTELMSKTSLLIAEITGSSGGSPLITPASHNQIPQKPQNPDAEGTFNA